MTIDDTWESVSCWGCFPTDPGKLERVAAAIRDDAANHCGLTLDFGVVFCDDARLDGIKDGYGNPIRHPACDCKKMAQAAIRAYERYEGRERVTNWELVV